MQRSGATPTQTAAPFFSSSFFAGSGSNNTSTTNVSSRSRPGTSAGEQVSSEKSAEPALPRQPNVLTKDRDRRPSFSRKGSFSSPGRGLRRRASSNSLPSNGASSNGGRPSLQLNTDTSIPPPPALPPDYALAAAAKLSRDNEALQSPASTDSFSKMLSRTAPTPTSAYSATMASSTTALAPPANIAPGQQSEATIVHQHIQEIANKRISTLDYLRKAHEGRVYWFNTLLFDKPDLARMPYFDSRRLARRATNFLLLGLSLPTIIDLYSSTPNEFLRCLNLLLTEFDSFQQLHSENGTSSSSLSRARLPQMFRRANPSSKGRRASGANDIGYPLEPSESNGGASTAPSMASSSSSSATVMAFAQSDTDLLPGEEYTHLLTPSLPFDPDFFETFATLCDVLIDCYTRLLSLVPTPRECNSSIAELFTKADSKVRKIIIQGVVKEFEDSSRAGTRTEVANVGKVVLGGLL
ncbi:hypothetical protein GQ53DRAFT_108371 [Thozetella sp. PMI_491]|nr:hypothetical protein GQ53DRAFT_108371 [Thozetella sp. PMI_491]